MCGGAQQRYIDRISQIRRVLLPLSLFLLLNIHLWFTVCGCSTEPEQATYTGTWVGYLKLGNDNGTITLEVSEDQTCLATGSVSGHITNWGDYELDLEGILTIGADGNVLGGVTIRRVCTMHDTTHATGTMSGQFNLSYATVSGTWTTSEGAPFLASGRWGGGKQ